MGPSMKRTTPRFFLTSLLAIASFSTVAATPATPPPIARKIATISPVAAAQALLDDLQHARYDAVFARFDDNMKAHVGTAQLQAVWESLPQQMGALKQRGTPTVTTKDGMTLVSVPLIFANGRLAAHVASNAAGQVIGFFIQPDAPPAPTARADLPSREVRFGPMDRTLPGTLLLPKTVLLKSSAANRRYPAVVLVHGSGAQDRDETVGGTRVFRDLAEGLADRGIASLRYEKRNKARPQDFSGAYTIDDETTDDAVAAVAFLRTQPEIDPARIFVIGHSQGAMMAPRIAQRSPQLAGIVLMAAPGRALEDIVLDQQTYLAMGDGKIDNKERAQLDALKLAIAKLKKLDPKTPPASKLLLDLPASYWRSLHGYDPVTVAKGLPQPMLILQGDRDFQVTAPDWTRWQSTFGADKRATIKHYPALNHLFVAGSGRGNIAEYSKPAHVAPQVIADIADWIQTQK